MPTPRQYRVIRDPLWNTIRMDSIAMRIVDTPAFQRLRYIRQLGHAHLVYPGATHTRFDHAVGVYHLAVKALRLIGEAHEVGASAWEGAELIPYAALLHDIGHYAFSHALEELEPDRIPAGHEEVSMRFFESKELAEALEPLGGEAPERIYALIRDKSDLPLRGLVSGSLDLDKMEYLRRDALFCGVPYGEVDVDRLLLGLLVLRDPVTGRQEVGIEEKAISALESLLFAKYQMFRNVYWHHAVRSATALYKRIVDDAVGAGLVAPEELVGPTDEDLLALVSQRAKHGQDVDPVARRIATRWLPALRARRLPKRAVELSAGDVKADELEGWLANDSRAKRAVEDEWARELDLEDGEVFIDFPTKPAMFQLNVLVRRASGEVQRLDDSGISGLIDLPRIARGLYETARVLRVFTFERRTVDPADAARRIRPT